MSEHVPEIPFDLRELDIFAAVCEAGSMSAAARALGLSQPAVSLAIAELERKTGASLLDRSVRPMALTPAGAVLRARAFTLLADAREIPSLLRDTVRGKVPLLRIGLVDSVSRALTETTAKFLTAHAESVSVLSGLTEAHAASLLTRRLDMLVGVDDLQETPGLERFELIKESYVLLLPGGAEPVETLEDLKRLAATLRFIRFSARSQTGLEIERHLRRLGVAVSSGIEFDTPFGVAASVAAGDGFAITTPLCLFQAQMPQNSVVAMRLPGPKISRTLTLVARQREVGNTPKELAGAMQAVLRKIKAEYRSIIMQRQ